MVGITYDSLGGQHCGADRLTPHPVAGERTIAQHCGTIRRTSGTLKEYGVVVVYLHLDDDTRLDLPVNRRFESPLVFRIPKALSLEALMAQPGDFVYVEWLPDQCVVRPNVHGGVVANVTKFHLSRNVPSPYGDGFHKPRWFGS